MYILTVHCEGQFFWKGNFLTIFAVGYRVVFKLAQTHQWTLLSMKHNSCIGVNHSNATASFQQCYYNMIILLRNINHK